MFGLAAGLAGGLWIGLVMVVVWLQIGYKFDNRRSPAHVDFRLRGRATALGLALEAGLGIAVWLGLLGWLKVGLAGGLMGGLVFGLVAGLITFAASPSIARRAHSPGASQRGDRQLTVFVISMLGLGGGLAVALGFGPVIPQVVGVVIGLVIARSCSAPFILASLWLGARRRLPFRLMAFLDDAYRLGLLRIVGPVYQFRHAALQDHLAPPAESQESAAIAGPAPQTM